MSEERITSEILDAARADTEIQSPPLDKPAFVFLPSPDGGVEAVELETSMWRAAPIRKTGLYQPLTLDSFIAHVKENLGDGTTIWVHPLNGTAVAIYDDHGADSPGWRQHTCVLALQKTEVWKHWASQDGNMLSQGDFAEHIEVGLDDIAEPAGATVLELAQSFHATNNASFRQAVRLHSGETQFQYDEELVAAAGKKGEITIPEFFKLAIEPFEGEPRYAVLARFRYRLSSGRLTLGYKLDRPDQVLRAALEKVTEKLTETFAGTTASVYIGEQPKL